MVGRFLITTANEQTWKFDRPVIFLGEWCRLYDRKHLWQAMDATVAKPYGLDQNQRSDDQIVVRTLENELLTVLSNVLNEYHREKHDERFWKIVIGHWLRYFCTAMLNRLRALELCIKENTISGITVLKDTKSNIAAADTYSSILQFNEDLFNSEIYYRALDFIDCNKPMVELAINKNDKPELCTKEFNKTRNSEKLVK